MALYESHGDTVHDSVGVTFFWTTDGERTTALATIWPDAVLIQSGGKGSKCLYSDMLLTIDEVFANTENTQTIHKVSRNQDL